MNENNHKEAAQQHAKKSVLKHSLPDGTTNNSHGPGNHSVRRVSLAGSSILSAPASVSPITQQQSNLSTSHAKNDSVLISPDSLALNNTNIQERNLRLSGYYNVNIWKAILHDDDEYSKFDFQEDHETKNRTSQNHTDVLTYAPCSVTETIAGSECPIPGYLPDVQGQDTNLSSRSGSITPGAITLSLEDLRKLHDRQDEEDSHYKSSSMKLISMNCTSKKTARHHSYKHLKTKFESASLSIENFYLSLLPQFETLEFQLSFPNETETTTSLSPELNILSAQLWFITLLFAKQAYQFKQPDLDYRNNFTHLYEQILQDSSILVELIKQLQLIISTFKEVGLEDGIAHLKKTLTGNYVTDLADEQIGNEVFITDLATRNKGGRFSIWDNKVVTYGGGRKYSTFSKSKSRISIKYDVHNEEEQEGYAQGLTFDLFFTSFDTLDERKKLDVYVRNITKVGWVNFDVQFKLKQKLQMEQEILIETKNSIKILRKGFSKIVKILNSGSNTSSTTKIVTSRFNIFPCIKNSKYCLKWINKMKKIIKYIVKSEEFTAEDYESLRLQILTVELCIQKVISRTNEFKYKIVNVISIVKLCCDFLTNVHKFTISKYTNIRPKLQLDPNFLFDGLFGNRKGGRLSNSRKHSSGISGRSMLQRKFPHATSFNNLVTNRELEDVDDADFFLNEYAALLKVIPISHGLMEYILENRVDLSQKHSGVNFDGPRFLNVRH